MIDEVALRGHLDVVERPIRPARLRIGKPPDDGDHRANEKENCRYPLPTNGPKSKSCVGWRFSCRRLGRGQNSIVFPISHGYSLPPVPLGQKTPNKGTIQVESRDALPPNR